WRGGAEVEITLNGTPAKLAVVADGSIRDFRHYDVTRADGFRLDAHCDAEYSAVDHALHDLLCKGPVDNGTITLRGDADVSLKGAFHLALTPENVPTNAVVALIQRTTNALPEDLTATGTLGGRFIFESVSVGPDGIRSKSYTGHGEIAGLHLSAAS